MVGVSASGRTPYVLGGLDAARAVGALTVAVVSVDGIAARQPAEHEIAVVVGPEILAGSTRLKAGTAQKLVLNMLSTIAMIRLGKTFGNLMVDVYATNEKLHARVRRVVREATGADPAQVEEALAAAGGDAKVAIVSLLGDVDVETARSAAGGGGRRHPRRARSVRLGVEAALVGGRLIPGDLEIVGGSVAAAGLPVAGGRGIAAPGFVDLQVNGFAGVDFLGADADGYAAAGDALLETGVTSYLPTFITSPESRSRRRAAQRAGRAPRPAHSRRASRRPVPLAAPPGDAPAVPPAAIRIRRCSRGCSTAGPVRLVTLAPELPGALDLVDELVARGITVSCGHSDATAAEASAAFDRGASTVTHLFNAMRPFSHRDPGIVGAALTRPGRDRAVDRRRRPPGARGGPARVGRSAGPRRARDRRDRRRRPRGRLVCASAR